MQSNSNCIREASNACFHTCCAKIPPPPSSSASASAPRRDFVSAILSTLDSTTTSFTNHESLPSSKQLLLTLTTALPNFLNTVLADSIRAREYHHLRLSAHVCLDYAGHGLFSYAQKAPPPDAPSTSAPPPSDADFFEFEYSSVNFTSRLLYGGDDEPSELHAAAKRRILRYMNLPEDDYSVVFTANQPSAFKILAHSYPFRSRPDLVTVYDHENEAAEAMAEAARRGGGRARSASFSWPSLRMNSRKLGKILSSKKKKKSGGLFVFPLQSRISGARYSYQWMNMAREHGWHVLLDATPLAAKEMETLGLSLFQPDFATCSFFNVFGDNPSGFCCLFVKKSTIPLLNQSPTNIGLIINLVPPKNPATAGLEEADLVTERDDQVRVVEFRGLDHADELGLILISTRMRYLVNWLVNALLSLRHPNSGDGVALVRVYGPRMRLDRGPAVAFNVFDWKGERVEPELVQKLADRNNISLSVGVLKNVCISGEERLMVKRRGKEGCEFGVGVVSASLGMLSNFEDVYRLWAFVSRFLDADFVEKERWRYTALNQTTVEV